MGPRASGWVGSSLAPPLVLPELKKDTLWNCVVIYCQVPWGPSRHALVDVKIDVMRRKDKLPQPARNDFQTNHFLLNILFKNEMFLCNT